MIQGGVSSPSPKPANGAIKIKVAEKKYLETYYDNSWNVCREPSDGLSPPPRKKT